MPRLDRAHEGLFARKSIEAAAGETRPSGFRRALGALDLTGIGIAAVIGAGIFALMGDVARADAGPWVVVSILIAGIAGVCAAFAYAELASMVPGSGSAYAYAYVAFGKLPAFLMAWIILNAYAVGNMTVAIAWNGIFADRMAAVGLALPASFTNPPMGDNPGIFNVPAAAIMIIATVLCLPRIRESTRLNNALVALKLAIVLLVIVAGAFFLDPSNWGQNEVSTAQGVAPVNWRGIVAGAATIFFAYLGFDTVAATGEEARNPRRDLPIGILVSVGVAALLYMAMGAVVTGMQPAASLDPDSPVTAAFAQQGADWVAALVGVGALVGLFTVMYAFQVALIRILHSMAMDGFLPSRLQRLHRSTGTPWGINLWTGALTALGAGLLDLGPVADTTVLASIYMYVFVALGVVILRLRRPEAPRPFRSPLWVAWLGIVLMLALAFIGIRDAMVHLAFVAWLGVGLILYGFYSHRASVRRAESGAALTPP